MCYFINKHNNHNLLKIDDEEKLKKANITIEYSINEFENNKDNLEELKNKIENELIKIDKSYERIDKEVTKSYELKHEKLIKEENELKDKLKNEVTKIKESLEINLSTTNNIIRNCERTIKSFKLFKDVNHTIKKLNYISNINKNQKEINILFKQLMKNLNLSFNDKNIIYDEYYFNWLPIPEDIKFSDIDICSFKVSWKIDETIIKDIDNKKIKYEIEIRKKDEEFRSVYIGNEKYYKVYNLEEDTDYEIRICLIYNNIKYNFSKIYNVKTDIDSIILNKSKRKKEFNNLILKWSGAKSMKLIYRGTRDGMTNKDFHNKCDNKGKTICLFLNDKGNIFGGYSSIRWTSNGGNKTTKDCFIFTLTNIYNTEPTKFPYEKGRSVYHHIKNGPTFGDGADLGFGSNFSSSNSSLSNFPYSYKDNLGKGKAIFTGDMNDNNHNYTLKELEVFESL